MVWKVNKTCIGGGNIKTKYKTPIVAYHGLSLLTKEKEKKDEKTH